LSIRRKFLGFGLVWAIAGGVAFPAQADLLPHRVIYSLDLGSGSSLTGGSGLMTFEIKDVCDGWAMDLKAEIALAGEDGQIHRLGWSQVSWEAKDGKRYRYFTRELSDDQETARRRGEARRESASGPANVVADLPEQAEFTLPAGTLFPVQHTEALIKGDAAGEAYVLANLFDGSIGNSAVEVGTALGQGSLEWKAPGKAFPDLNGLRSFPAALAFYIGNTAEGVPDTEQSMRLFSNGVVGSLTFTLGDLKVHAIMDELTPLAPESC
jgi:hypothetical protein